MATAAAARSRSISLQGQRILTLPVSLPCRIRCSRFPLVSYLSFTVSCLGAAGLIHTGSAISFFRETIVRSRTGVELSRSVSQDISRFHSQNYRVAADYYRTVGAGIKNSTVAEKVTVPVTPSNPVGGVDSAQFVIPISDLNPFFRCSFFIIRV